MLPDSGIIPILVPAAPKESWRGVKARYELRKEQLVELFKQMRKIRGKNKDKMNFQ